MKVDQWHEKLAVRISEIRPVEFQWGQMDCGLFALECVEAITGKELTGFFRGEYDDEKGAFVRAREWAKANDVDCEIGCIGDFGRNYFPWTGMVPVDTNYMNRGDVALVDNVGQQGTNALGVCYGSKIAVVAEQIEFRYFDRSRAIEVWSYQ